jgi:uncharacterized protein (DUF4213/DUF364 family)
LAELLRSSSTLEASIGIAALNAPPKADEDSCAVVNAEEVILRHGTGRRVAIVGHLPFLERVGAAAEQCWVIEVHPRPGDISADRAAEVLPLADVVALTGTSLINHTFDELLAPCREDSFIVPLGPSAPLAPVLPELGVSVISGIRVLDGDRVICSVSQGANFRQIKRAGGLALLTFSKDEIRMTEETNG